MLHNPLFRKGAIGALLIVVVVWGSVAIGSYVYLAQMGYVDEFDFPFNQLIVAIPYVLTDPWHGIETLNVWKATLFGLVASIAPGAIIAYPGMRWLGFGRTPTLYGDTGGFADRGAMRRGGIKIGRRIF